jgi:hypothetical protein
MSRPAEHLAPFVRNPKSRRCRWGYVTEPEALYPPCGYRHAHSERNRPPDSRRPSDNASLEDIQCHIYVREKIERGLRDVEAGRVVDQDQAKRRMAKWPGE